MLCGGVAACLRYGLCTVRCFESRLNTANSTHTINKACICWCMNFIDIKMHGTTIKNNVVNK